MRMPANILLRISAEVHTKISPGIPKMPFGIFPNILLAIFPQNSSTISSMLVSYKDVSRMYPTISSGFFARILLEFPSDYLVVFSQIHFNS